MTVMEMPARRFQLIVAAHKQDPSKPNYDEAKYYRGLGSPLDAVQPSLTTVATKKFIMTKCPT